MVAVLYRQLGAAAWSFSPSPRSMSLLVDVTAGSYLDEVTGGATVLRLPCLGPALTADEVVSHALEGRPGFRMLGTDFEVSHA